MTDREKVILALELCRYDPDPGQEKKWYHSCLKCPYCTDRNGMEMNCAQMYTDAIALLREQGAVTDTNVLGKWISVKDRLPEEGVCLGCHGSSVGIYGYVFGEWFDEDDCICGEGYVTHWMPLPKPPKEETP